ncbi:MAG: GTP 3',8-cyclase MoaA [Mogibacterium sp.]|nr:GTP 3',8-cyclase MoaA [Mogibacterium sp.]
MKDNYGRTINYMRISITDRCNMRCRYCMPDGIEKVSMSKILTYEDILRIAEAATGIGITRFKITGGEPLVRLGCADLIRDIKALPGTEQVTITTNGMELAKYMPDLKAAGIDAINVSLDTMDKDKFRYITQCGDLEKVMEGIESAIASGIRTKINCVPQKGFNENEIPDFAKFAFAKGIDIRFIELMPIGQSDAGKGLSNDAILSKLSEIYPELEPDGSIHGNGPAVYYQIPGKKGGIGLISAMHGIFCSSCNRIRLTSQGMIKPCLCYEESIDIKPALEGNIQDIQELLKRAVEIKPGQHCFNEMPDNIEKRSMSQIGG